MKRSARKAARASTCSACKAVVDVGDIVVSRMGGTIHLRCDFGPYGSWNRVPRGKSRTWDEQVEAELA